MHADLYAAVDELADKLDRQVLRHKDKIQEHRPRECQARPAVSVDPLWHNAHGAKPLDASSGFFVVRVY